MVICCARGGRRSLLDSLFVGWTVRGGDVWWTVFAGPWLLVELVCGETQEEHWWNLDLRRIDDDDNGASCHTASTRVIHAQSSSGSRILTCRCSASNQQSRDSSSSERRFESHRCERPWSSDGIH